jgi:hypothetical protein
MTKLKISPYVSPAKKKRPERLVKPFPTLDEFKVGIQRAAERKAAKKVYARLEREDAALLLDEEDI